MPPSHCECTACSFLGMVDPPTKTAPNFYRVNVGVTMPRKHRLAAFRLRVQAARGLCSTSNRCKQVIDEDLSGQSRAQAALICSASTFVVAIRLAARAFRASARRLPGLLHQTFMIVDQQRRAFRAFLRAGCPGLCSTSCRCTSISDEGHSGIAHRPPEIAAQTTLLPARLFGQTWPPKPPQKRRGGTHPPGTKNNPTDQF